VAQAAINAGLGWPVLNRDASYIAELRQASKVPIFGVSSDQVGRQNRRAALRPAIAAGRSNSIYRGTIPERGFAGTGIGTSGNKATKHPRYGAEGPMGGGKRSKIGKLVAKTVDHAENGN
jgi:hypothetical protein